MIAAYVDSSVLLRIILQEPDPLAEWDALTLGVSSALIRVECRRTFERFWRQNQMDEAELAQKAAAAETTLRRFDLRSVDQAILARAAEPFPTYVATLDAIHLATALAYRRAQPDDERPILFATHDRQLARAAAALDFEVIGTEAA